MLKLDLMPSFTKDSLYKSHSSAAAFLHLNKDKKLTAYKCILQAQRDKESFVLMYYTAKMFLQRFFPHVSFLVVHF